MGKHILLIAVDTGELVTEYTNESPAIANVTALRKTLLSEVEDLRDDQVITLINPNLRQMRHALALITYRCRHDDLCLIYYTGCGVIDPHTGTIYLANSDTRPDAITTTSISSDYIRHALPSLQTELNRVMILDCMWGSLPAQTMPYVPTEHTSRLATAHLADCNCALFTALGTNTNPWPRMDDAELSLYTQCLIEGFSTGLADIDADGGVSSNDLQAYMAQTLNQTHCDIFPITLCSSDNRKPNDRSIPMLQVRPYSPEREYRHCLEDYAQRHRGHIPPHHRDVLEFLRYQLGITFDHSQAIEAEVMAPYADHQESCDRYRQALLAALDLENPLGKPLKKWLRHLQSELSLNYEDVCTIEAQVMTQAIPQSNLQTLPRWLTPVDRRQLPARVSNQSG
ncbi:MAG: hypothetical protein ACFB14_05705 [Leptolyngbyaceae cyanobacterium]